jgi:endoglucanase
MRIKKASILALAIILYLPSSAFAQNFWAKYKAAFLSKDGRVVDIYQNHSSHSESQGYGMLLAAAYDDREVFNKISLWTENNMNKRGDSLIPWLWGKRKNGAWGVIDLNNATDGDILIALALIKAHEKWNVPGYLKRAKMILKDVRTLLAVKWNGHTLLLTSYYGNAFEKGIILNPSYFLFTAYRKFAEYDDRAFWDSVYDGSMYVLEKSAFGSYGMPPEWVKLSGSDVGIFSKKSSLFSYNAVRTLLNLALIEPKKLPKGVEKILKVYDTLNYIPAWIDLERNAMSLDSASAGFYAVFGLVAKKLGKKDLSERLFGEAQKKLAYDEKSYYSYSLFLLATNENAL